MTTNTPKILLLEDETMLAHNIVRYLGRRGLHVAVASRAAQGRAMCRAEHYEVMILDVNLPDGNGLQLYAELRDQMKNTRVIAVSGNPSAEVGARAEQLNIVHFFTKPFALGHLARAVVECLSGGDSLAPDERATSAG